MLKEMSGINLPPTWIRPADSRKAFHCFCSRYWCCGQSVGRKGHAQSNISRESVLHTSMGRLFGQGPAWTWFCRGEAAQLCRCEETPLAASSAEAVPGLRVLTQSTSRHEVAILTKGEDMTCLWTYITYRRLPVPESSVLKYWQHFASTFPMSWF